jgi:hypothetical protein
MARGVNNCNGVDKKVSLLPQKNSSNSKDLRNSGIKLKEVNKDQTSRHRSLLNTGSEFCVFTRKLVPGRNELVNYDLFAANRTTIPTYGWISLSLDLGLRRDFT